MDWKQSKNNKIIKGEKMIRGGYRGKILRVDLTKGSIATEDLPGESILRKYVGNFGLGLWYLMKELPDGVGALEPESPLIFLNAPLVGWSILRTILSRPRLVTLPPLPLSAL